MSYDAGVMFWGEPHVKTSGSRRHELDKSGRKGSMARLCCNAAGCAVIWCGERAREGERAPLSYFMAYRYDVVLSVAGTR